MVIWYRGTSPKLGSCQGECPYLCDYVSFAGEERGVFDDVDLSSIFQGIGSLRESWIRGCPDGRTKTIGRIPGIWRYKIEDFVPCLDGTFLGVEGKLGDRLWRFLFCNRPHVTLDLSGVYINRELSPEGTFMIIVIQAKLLGFSHYDLVVDQLL